MSDESVEVRDLTKIYTDDARGEVRAVDGISFTCRPGEVFGLLGANGAGKTTTLRMLSTVLSPTSGTATVAGFDIVAGAADVRRSIGFYSSSTALYPRLTARETLEFFARINRYPEAKVQARVDEIISRFSMEPFASARVDKLSSGQKQKVSIARTIAHDPPVLVFDEPTVALDVLAALDMRAVIGELRDAGKTVLFSTHVMSEAEKLCDRIAIIHEGRIHTTGTLASLREATGLHYLEDIFVHYVREARADAEGVRA
ncbi:MAG: ABC transporter ATP-binding protein [Blastocatellia bacterium]|nr:ABC transporter ATP-binding protein [Blastocatellia bacterium]